MINSFNTNVAIEFGDRVALLIQHFAQWTFNNLANKRNIHDGYCWSYDTLEALQKTFPYWTKSQLETTIGNAVKAGLIIKGNYNAHKYDRTCWYALNYKTYTFYSELQQWDFAKLLFDTISENSEMLFADFGKAVLEIRTPIPTNKPTNKPTNTPIVPKGDEVGFESFWKLYPTKKGKKQCEDKWRRLKLDDQAEQIVAALQNQIANDDQWKRGFIPNPITYINGARWNDEISQPRSGKQQKKINPTL